MGLNILLSLTARRVSFVRRVFLISGAVFVDEAVEFLSQEIEVKFSSIVREFFRAIKSDCFTTAMGGAVVLPQLTVDLLIYFRSEVHRSRLL